MPNDKSWIFAMFDKAMVSYYFCTLSLLLLPPIYYVMFRSSMNSWMRKRKIGKNRIKKLKKGMKNYWWYESLHQACDLGIRYHLNKWATSLYLVTLMLALLFGWLKALAPLLSLLFTVISLLLSVMNVFTFTQNNIDEYGTPFVLFGQRSNKGVDSILFDLLFTAFPLFTAYAHIKMTLDILL